MRLRKERLLYPAARHRGTGFPDYEFTQLLRVIAAAHFQNTDQTFTGQVFNLILEVNDVVGHIGDAVLGNLREGEQVSFHW